MTALRASADLAAGDSFAIRAFPPLRPPSLPKATAAGFFSLPVSLRERLGIHIGYRFVIECPESDVNCENFLRIICWANDVGR